MLYRRVNPVVNRKFTPDLRVLPAVAAYSYMFISELFWGNYLKFIHFVYFDYQEATVVLDITIQFIASDGNKYSVASYLRGDGRVRCIEGAYKLPEIHLCLLETYVGHFQILSLYM